MITKKQIEKLAQAKLGPCRFYEFPDNNGWFIYVASSIESFKIHAAAPSRPVARAGLNAMLFALPKRRRAVR